MKKSQYKGTPHPKKRRPLEPITNQDHRGSKKYPDATSSPLKRLHSVHSSIARLLEKIDSLVTGIHKKKFSEKLSADEINNFNRAMLNVEGTLQEWHAFFLQASRRANIPENQRYNQQLSNDNLIPMNDRSSNQLELSDSPLVSGGSNQDDSRKALHFTPQLSASKFRRNPVTPPVASSLKKPRLGPQTRSSSPSVSSSGNKKVTFAATTPETITPAFNSPPRSVRLLRPSVSSSSSCLSTPSFLLRSPPSLELPATPQAPPEIICKYPKWFSKLSAGSQPEKSPGMSASPPRTCALLGSSIDNEHHSPIAVPPISPFRTPGLVLRSPSLEESPVSDPGTGGVTSKLASLSV